MSLTRGIAACVFLTLASFGSASGIRSPKAAPKVSNVSYDCVLDFFQATNKGRSQVGTLISLAQVYARAGNREKALRLMTRARQEAEAEQAHPTPPATDARSRALAPFLRLNPDNQLSSFAKGYLSVGAYDDALEFARKIANPTGRAQNLASIAEGMASAGDKQKAVGLLREALQAINTSTDQSDALADVSSSLARLGDCEQARRLALSMPDKRAPAKVAALTGITSECAKAGSKEGAAQAISEALRVTGSMSRKSESLARVASAQLDIGDRESALGLLAEALPEDRNAGYNAKTMEVIADAYAHAHLFDKAVEVADSIGDRPTQAAALLDIARRYLAAGDKTNAAELIDRSLKLILRDRRSLERFRRLGEIAVEYARASRRDAANNILLEALREIRREEYSLSDLLLSVLLAYGEAGLTPDARATQLIGKLCSGEAFRLTSEEEAQQRRAEAAAEAFIERWHQTLDLNVLFEEQYVSNPTQRQRNIKMFYGVYRFWAGSSGLTMDKDIEEALMREFFFTFWNWAYLSEEYDLAFRAPDQQRLARPPEMEKQPRPSRQASGDGKRVSREEVVVTTDTIKSTLPTYRKYLNPQVFRTARYLSNLKRKEEERKSRRFKIESGPAEFDVPENRDVYYLRKGVFEFYFIEEDGKLKVLTLGFEL